MFVILSVAIRVRGKRPEDWVPAEDASVDCDNHCDETHPGHYNGGMQFRFFWYCCPEGTEILSVSPQRVHRNRNTPLPDVVPGCILFNLLFLMIVGGADDGALRKNKIKRAERGEMLLQQMLARRT